MDKRQFCQAIVSGCIGWLPCPNYDVHSNTLPLAFGMTPDAVSAALKSPLTLVASGRGGSDIYYAEGTPVVTWFIVAERERLWMQFRHGRLTGWKYDWDRPIGMW
jgi:hypothetical protein